MGSKQENHASDGSVRGDGLLAFKVAGLILLTLILFLIPLVWTVDSVLRERLMRQALDTIQQQDQQWQEELSHDLRAAERSIGNFAHLLSTHVRPPRPEDEIAFQALVQRDADGLWRSRRDQFQPAHDAGIWAPEPALARPEDRSFFLQAKQLMEIFGPGAAEHLFANTWALPRDNGEIVFWPNVPDFIYQVPADQDYRDTEWFQLVAPDRNPAAEPRWTSTSFDPVPKVWMISVVAPFQRNGHWGGSVGHDLVINELFQRLDVSMMHHDSEVFLIDHDQRLLIATRHQAEIEASLGQMRAGGLSDHTCAGLLQRVLQLAGPGPNRNPVVLDTGEVLITALPLVRPDWLMVHIVPRQAARALVEGPLLWLRWGLAISMLTLLLACGLVISRDTLRRVRAEQELRNTMATLQNYESFINRSPAVVFLWRAEPGWPVEFVSENVIQFGYEARDMMSGKVSWIGTLHPEDLPKLEAEVEQNREQGRTEFDVRFRLHTADGEIRWVENRILLLIDGHGQLRHVQGIMLDITASQRVQAELQAEQQRYQTLFNHTGASIMYIDRDGRLQMINGAACRCLQRDATYLIHRTVEEIFPLDLADKVRERLEESLHQPGSKTYEDKVELPDGTCWYVSTYTSIRDAQGQFMGLQVVSQDVTENKATKAALAVSEDRYRTIVETAQEGVWVLDAQAHTTFVNQRMAEMLGYLPEEMMGHSLFDFMDKEAIRKAEEGFERRKRGIKESHDFRFRRKDGTDLWAIVSTNPLQDEQGRFCGSLGLITDITDRHHSEQERHKLEQRIQQAQKLESLGIMAAGIAHDFNNLLQAILGHAELALQDAPPDSPQQESLREIHKSAQRAGVISAQMMAYVGQGKSKRMVLHLDALLTELQPTLKALANEHALLTVEWDPALPTLLADPVELKQTLVQLVTNAVEAQTSQPGRISLRASYRPWRRLELQELFAAPELSEGNYLTLVITDTGCGIDRATMSHMFEPFFSTKFPGRGLGLMNVLGFVRSHGGGIKVESMPGQGTAITLLLPEAPDARPTTEFPMPWGWRGHGTILMVDDDATVLTVGRRLLTELGYNVITAGDGQEAIHVYRAQQDVILCVVLDLVMPGMDGTQTLAALREIKPELKVVIATAYPTDKATELLQGLSYQGLVHKPYSSAILARLLQGLLG